MTEKDKILMPKELTAENGAKLLLSGEFEICQVMQCSECNNHEVEYEEDIESCECCNGSGSYNLYVSIDWPTIKAIYKMAVKGLGEEL